MERKRSAFGDAAAIGAFPVPNSQGSLQLPQQRNPHGYQQGPMVQPQFQDAHFRIQNVQQPEQPSFFNVSEDERETKSTAKMENEESVDGHDETGAEKKVPLWQRTKWTGIMIKLLITALSYIDKGIFSHCIGGTRRKSSVPQKIGKWKSVSKAMVKRGYHVSPQQCEDKFNDLNKRYKRLNDILGRGTACNVVENPELLDVMDLPEKAKEEVKKILNFKNLFYKELCSYHNGNRLHLPHDLDLQRSLQLALRSNDDDGPHELGQPKANDFGKQEHDAGADDPTEQSEDDCGNPWLLDVSSKRFKQTESLTVVEQNDQTGRNNLYPKDSNVDGLQEQWMVLRLHQLEEEKLQIRSQMLKLKNQQSKWQSINRRQDKELEKLRQQNECIKFENERIALELERKKILD